MSLNSAYLTRRIPAVTSPAAVLLVLLALALTVSGGREALAAGGATPIATAGAEAGGVLVRYGHCCGCQSADVAPRATGLPNGTAPTRDPAEQQPEQSAFRASQTPPEPQHHRPTRRTYRRNRNSQEVEEEIAE